MHAELTHIPTAQLDRAALEASQDLIAVAGEKAAWRIIEFFTANIRNRNTRAAYAQAVRQFFAWCDDYGIISLEQIRPVLVAAYVEQLQATMSAPSVKQHLAAIRTHAGRRLLPKRQALVVPPA